MRVVFASDGQCTVSSLWMAQMVRGGRDPTIGLESIKVVGLSFVPIVMFGGHSSPRDSRYGGGRKAKRASVVLSARSVLEVLIAWKR